MVNPTVFFDIAVDGEPLGRVSFEVGWQACGVWQSERRHEYCGGHGALWVQEWQDQQEDHHC
uniref:Peptidylprolyl isomerase A n=1 Tax=Homo sapiens TaxID=9606 RepID=A0A7P0S768_HUMAN